ncbi:hypothetical protein [Aliikangiella maris]|uniref:Uncharacterized protein n=2 Tax=Aliikangiella maris TaxID=3162458 RepID=A0ABV3MMW5_9GAMM
MQLLGLRFCLVSEQSNDVIQFFEQKLGFSNSFGQSESCDGGIFKTLNDDSWLEVWQQSEQMPAGIMLQLVVDDADKLAEAASNQGVELMGPMEAHGERIYFTRVPGGLNMSFQSRLNA